LPKIALADLLHDWERLLETAEQRVEEFPVLAPDLAALRADLARVRELEVERAQLQAARQKASRELDRVKAHGTDQARDVRNRLRSLLGSRNPLHREFKIRPLRP
jgi:DNA repair exonuclease SbcCD ATPase subunit